MELNFEFLLIKKMKKIGLINKMKDDKPSSKVAPTSY